MARRTTLDPQGLLASREAADEGGIAGNERRVGTERRLVLRHSARVRLVLPGEQQAVGGTRRCLVVSEGEARRWSADEANPQDWLARPKLRDHQTLPRLPRHRRLQNES